MRKLLEPDARVDRSAEVNKLWDLIRETSFDIHKFLRSGHLEKVYENALAHRLTKLGIGIIQQHPLDVCDEVEPFSDISVRICL